MRRLREYQMIVVNPDGDDYRIPEATILTTGTATDAVREFKEDCPMYRDRVLYAVLTSYASKRGRL